MNELLNEYADMTYSEYESYIQGIVDNITKGKKQDRYKDWAKHPDVSVREALVVNGYELNTLIHDPLSSIRMEVVRKDPNYIKEALCYKLSTTDWQTVYQKLVKIIDPDPEVLIAFMGLGIPSNLTEYESTYYTTFEIFRSQIKGIRHNQTTLERTMTTIQRYLQKHPGRGFGDAEGAIISEGHGRARVYSRDEHEIKLLDGNLLRNPYFKVTY